MAIRSSKNPRFMIYFLLGSPKWVAQVANPMHHRRL
jgi:hypothetical protein